LNINKRRRRKEGGERREKGEVKTFAISLVEVVRGIAQTQRKEFPNFHIKNEEKKRKEKKRKEKKRKEKIYTSRRE
jgi:hypothetical protein